MKITIIHGSQRKGNTEKTIEIVEKKLNSIENNEFFHFYLPKDLPLFCCGCFRCFEEGSFGGEFCPHSKYTHPILDALKKSDGIIIASPVYSLSESGQIKGFLDHFACIFMPHRPLKEMFSKSAFIISTTAGAGTKHSIRPIARSLKFWGIPKMYKCGFNLWAKEWSEMAIRKQNKYEKILKKKSYAFYKSMNCKQKYIPVQTKILFNIFKRFINSCPDGNTDKEYWRENGWLQGNRPWKRSRR
ncbi:flavodoxin family protein [Clostridium sp. CTA-19]